MFSRIIKRPIITSTILSLNNKKIINNNINIFTNELSINVDKFNYQKLYSKDELSEKYKQYSKEYEDIKSLKFDKNIEMTMKNGRDIFANVELSLEDIKGVGFDYDYTLANYNVNVEYLIYNLAKKHLIEKLGYPSEISSLQYDPNFPIRGLHFDSNHGLILKLDFFGNISPAASYFGRKKITLEKLNELYGSTHLDYIYFKEHIKYFADQFCLPELCLTADIIQFIVDKGWEFDAGFIYNDIRKSIERVHHTNEFHNTVEKDISTFLNKQPKLAELLCRWKDDGKTLFVATNSHYSFIDTGLSYLLDDELSRNTPYKSWKDLFDIKIVSSKKPLFFTENRPFRRITANKLRWEKIYKFEKSEIYVGGSLKHFQNLSNIPNNKILYFGDHLDNDLKEPQRRAGWKTGYLVKELEREIEIQNSIGYQQNLHKYIALEDLLHKIGYYYKTNECEDQKRLNKLRNSILKEREVTKTTLKHLFNPNFGSCFRLSSNGTTFSLNLRRCVDVYTSHIENFLDYPPSFTFYPKRSYLPHEAVVDYQSK